MPRGRFFVRTDEESDREQRGTGRDDNKKKNKKTAQILLLRYLTYFALRRRQNCQPIKSDDYESGCIPTCNQCVLEPKMSARGKEYRCTGGQSYNETLPRVWTANKIDEAHLGIRLTNIRPQWQAAIATAVGGAPRRDPLNPPDPWFSSS